MPPPRLKTAIDREKPVSELQREAINLLSDKQGCRRSMKEVLPLMVLGILALIVAALFAGALQVTDTNNNFAFHPLRLADLWDLGGR